MLRRYPGGGLNDGDGCRLVKVVNDSILFHVYTHSHTHTHSRIRLVTHAHLADVIIVASPGDSQDEKTARCV